MISCGSFTWIFKLLVYDGRIATYYSHITALTSPMLNLYLTLQVESAHTAEVVTTLKGTVFRVAETSPDMYASIDLVSNRLVSFNYNI